MNILRQVHVLAPKWSVQRMLQKSVWAGARRGWGIHVILLAFCSSPPACQSNGFDRMAAGPIPSLLQRQQLESGIKHEANQAYGIP
jgi:hypothetical protein